MLYSMYPLFITCDTPDSAQLVTGHHPFHNTNRFQVGMLVLSGQRPSRPGKDEQKIYLSDCIWSLIGISWREHTRRPSMREIGVAFKLLYNGSVVLSSPINRADLFNEANKRNPQDAEAIRLLCKIGGVCLPDSEQSPNESRDRPF
jgi:hypothetical protein